MLRIELLLSGELDRLAVQFSWRYAALEAAGSHIMPALLEAEYEHFRARTGLDADTITDWLARLGRNQRWFDEMLTLEGRHARRTHGPARPLFSSLQPAIGHLIDVAEFRGRAGRRVPGPAWRAILYSFHDSRPFPTMAAFPSRSDALPVAGAFKPRSLQ